MLGVKKPIIKFLVLDLIFVIICFFSFIHILQRADLPFEIESGNNKIIVVHSEFNQESNTDELSLFKINQIEVINVEQIEFLLDGIKAGDYVDLELINNGKIISKSVQTKNFYEIGYLLVATFVSIFFFIIAIIVLLKQPVEKSARIFHHVSIGAALIMMTTWGYYNISPQGIGLIIRSIFSTAYVVAPALFLDFTLIYPRQKKKIRKIIIPFLYSTAFLLSFITSYLFIVAADEVTYQSMQNYLFSYKISQYFLVANLIIGLVVFILSYIRAKESSEKQKLIWILFGIFFGLVPYIVLWVLPLIIWGDYFVPEEIVLLFTLLIPITFGISIVKYRLLNVEVIFERSIIYLISVILLLVVTSSIIIGISYFFDLEHSTTLSVVTAVFVALLFQPANKKIKELVDKKFFSIRYDFRMALKKFLTEIQEVNNVELLVEILVKRTEKLIPVNKIGFFKLDQTSSRFHLMSHSGFEILEGRSVKFDFKNLKTNLLHPVAIENKVENGAEFEIADVKVFRRWGMDLVFPIKSVTGTIFGFLVLGRKKSNLKFSLEDMDLLTTITSRTAVVMERIKLQKELIREQLQAEQLEELNKMKSFYISTVTHDLKTPLTSIKMFSELIKSNKNLSVEKRNDFLGIIEGESDRLSRLINSVLDYAKIEQDIKKYNFNYANVNKLLKGVLDSMDYQFRMEKFFIEHTLTEESDLVWCDGDAVVEAVINLLSNAMKYSGKNKIIQVSTYVKDGYFCIKVKDEGIGIKENDIEKIFEPFNRTEEEKVHKQTGSGLGLAIIKHIVKAHNGKIDLKSEWGKGSIFILLFPVDKNE